jgi:hypothetical protein
MAIMKDPGVDGYGLDSHGVEIRCPEGIKDFYILHSDQNGCAVNRLPIQWTLEPLISQERVRGAHPLLPCVTWHGSSLNTDSLTFTLTVNSRQKSQAHQKHFFTEIMFLEVIKINLVTFHGSPIMVSLRFWEVSLYNITMIVILEQNL